jgi:hypothetical protein
MSFKEFISLKEGIVTVERDNITDRSGSCTDPDAPPSTGLEPNTVLYGLLAGLNAYDLIGGVDVRCAPAQV